MRPGISCVNAAEKEDKFFPPSPLPPIASFPYQTKKRLGTGVEGEERERGPFTSRAAFQTVRYTYVVGHLKRHTFSPGSFLRTCRKKTCLLLLGVCPPPFEDGIGVGKGIWGSVFQSQEFRFSEVPSPKRRLGSPPLHRAIEP